MRFAALFCACLPLFAQTNAGTITGTVFDATQAVIEGVKVTAHNLATNVAQPATTNASGVYSLPALEPGALGSGHEHSGCGEFPQSG